MTCIINRFLALCFVELVFYGIGLAPISMAADPVGDTKKEIQKLKVGAKDWPQWGGSPFRNNTPADQKVSTDWNIKTGKNISWSMPLGSETYGNPVVANGKVYVGTNNGAAYLKRYSAEIDLGVLLCFNDKDGKFLWQHSNEKLPAGRVNDWPHQGICCAPFVDGDRLWYVTSRGEVVCLDTEGFLDGENDGPVKDEPNENKDEADVVWRMNMMKELGTFQHNMCSCSVTCVGDYLFVNTSNGVDDAHIVIPQAAAPTFVCMNRNTGKVLWTDNSPGSNVLHGQWSSPSYAVIGGQAQVLFGGGDGYLYSFDPAGENGKSKLLWKFDCNPKDSVYLLGGRATRNHIIGTPVIYDNKIYVAVGEDPEHGEGVGHLWCINPTKRGDVSPTLVFNAKDLSKPIAHKRIQAKVEKDGDIERDNPNSAVIWHYQGNNKSEFEQTMHRTCGTVAIKNDLLFIADFSGIFHCIDAQTGASYWTHDMFAASWASALIVNDLVFMGDEDGDISIFKMSKEKQLIREINLGSSLYTTPIVANDSIYISNKNRIFKITEGTQSAPPKKDD